MLLLPPTRALVRRIAACAAASPPAPPASGPRVRSRRAACNGAPTGTARPRTTSTRRRPRSRTTRRRDPRCPTRPLRRERRSGPRRAARGARDGFSDALTVSFGDASSEVYGTLRLGLSAGSAASGLAMIFDRSEVAAVAAENAVPVTTARAGIRSAPRGSMSRRSSRCAAGAWHSQATARASTWSSRRSARRSRWRTTTRSRSSAG